MLIASENMNKLIKPNENFRWQKIASVRLRNQDGKAIKIFHLETIS
jgi:hypothetical protein